MKTQKSLGIWMDHSIANLIDLKSKKPSRSIVSKFTFDTKEEALNKSESLIKHALAVEGVMRYFARKRGEDEDNERRNSG